MSPHSSDDLYLLFWLYPCSTVWFVDLVTCCSMSWYMDCHTGTRWCSGLLNSNKLKKKKSLKLGTRYFFYIATNNNVFRLL